MDGQQMTIFDYPECLPSKEKTFEQIHEEMPWARMCHGVESECFENPENGICTSTWKCRKRMEYISLSHYYMDQIGCEALNNPVDSSRILCWKNQAEADALIKKWKEYYNRD